MPKKVITRRQRKAAEAKRIAEEDARLGVVKDKGSDGAGSLPALKLPRKQKKKAKKNVQTTPSTTKEPKVVKPSSSSLLFDTNSKMSTATSSTWYDAGKPKPPPLPPISEALSEMDTRRSTEQFSRLGGVLPFGTRLYRRIARRFRSVSLSGVTGKEKPQQKVPEDPQPTLKQLNALHKIILQKRKKYIQDDFFGKLKYPKNPSDQCGEVEKQATEILQKYMQSFYNGSENSYEANQLKKSKKKAANRRKKRSERQMSDPYSVPVPRIVEEQQPLLKFIGHTGYFILIGTDDQLVRQLDKMANQNECTQKCPLLLANLTENVEQELEKLEQNRAQILKQMHEKYAMLEPKRQRRQKRPHKYNQVGKAAVAAPTARTNCSPKGSQKKQRGTGTSAGTSTMLAPAAERRAVTC